MLRLQLPGVWVWHDFASDSLGAALDRLPKDSHLDLVTFANRLAAAAKADARVLAVCVELEDSVVDVQVSVFEAPLAIAYGNPTGLKAAAWTYSFLLGAQPRVSDLLDGPDALPALRYEHPSGNEVSIVCSSPGDEPPVVLTFRFGEALSNAGRDLCEWIVVSSTWADESPPA